MTSRHTKDILDLTPNFRRRTFRPVNYNKFSGGGNVGGAIAGTQAWISTALNNAKIGDTSEIEEGIENNRSLAFGNQNFNTNDSLMQAWDQYSPLNPVTAHEIRGMSGLGKVGNSLKASAEGAAAGAAAGGPWGALIGGVVGLGAGIGGVLVGDKAARKMRDKLNRQIRATNELAYDTLSEQTSEVAQKNLWRAEDNYIAYGGPLENPTLNKKLAGQQLEELYGNGLSSTKKFNYGGELPEYKANPLPIGMENGIFIFEDTPTPEQLEARKRYPEMFEEYDFIDRGTPDDIVKQFSGGGNVMLSVEPTSYSSPIETLMPFIKMAQEERERKEAKEEEKRRLEDEAKYRAEDEKRTRQMIEDIKNQYEARETAMRPQQPAESTSSVVIPDNAYYEDPSEELINSIMNFESFSAEPYYDINGYAIGYGDHDPQTVNYYRAHPNERFPQEEGVKLLRRTVNWVRGVLSKNIKNWYKLTGPQKDALTSLGLNTGPENVINNLGLMQGLDSEDWEMVARNMSAGWNQVDDQGRLLRGLRKRRNYEMLPFQNPTMTKYGVLPDGTVVNPDDLLNVDKYGWSKSGGTWDSKTEYRGYNDEVKPDKNGSISVYVPVQRNRAYGGNLYLGGGFSGRGFKNPYMNTFLDDERVTETPVELEDYAVQKGDFLAKIAARRGTTVNEILKYNNLKDPNKVFVGNVLKVPKMKQQTVPVETYRNTASAPSMTTTTAENNYDEYVVKPGDSLSKIEKETGVPLGQILKYNKIPNPNIINVGQKIRLPKKEQLNFESYINDPANSRYAPFAKLYQQGSYNHHDLRRAEAVFNDASDTDIITNYMQITNPGEYYLIDDKTNDRISVYKGNQLVKSYTAAHGANKGDLLTRVPYRTDAKGKVLRDSKGQPLYDWSNSRMSTGAGITRVRPSGTYHSEPAFMRQYPEEWEEGKKDSSFPASIHVRQWTKLRSTNGCTGLSAKDIRDLSKYIKNGTYCYLLPEDEGNRFALRNGKLSFLSSDEQRIRSVVEKDRTPIAHITTTLPLETPEQKVTFTEMADTLKNVQQYFQSKYGINKDTFDTAVSDVLAIAFKESSMGIKRGDTMNSIKTILKYLDKNFAGPDVYYKENVLKLKEPNRSRGITQLREVYLPDAVKEDMKNFGVTMDDLITPKGAAIATLSKYINEYLGQGRNRDKTVKMFNTHPDYLNRINSFADKISVISNYGEKYVPPKPFYEQTPVERTAPVWSANPSFFPQQKAYGGNLFAFGTEDPYAAAGRRYKNARTALVNNGYSEGDATRLARILATQAVLESGYRDNSDNNYGGHLDPRSKKRMHYNNEEDFWKAQIDTLSKKWPEWNKAQTLSDYYNTINHTDLGLNTLEKFNAYNKAHRGNEVYLYAPEWENEGYLNKLNGIYNRASKYYNDELETPTFLKMPEQKNNTVIDWQNLHFGNGGNLFWPGGSTNGEPDDKNKWSQSKDYAYISDVLTPMVQNSPTFFWSDDPKAKEAREWAHRNYPQFMDWAYQNTPEKIRKTISPKKLTKTTVKNNYMKDFEQRRQEGSNLALATIGRGLLTGMTAPLIAPLASAGTVAEAGLALANLAGMTGGAMVGEKVGKKVDNYLKDKYGFDTSQSLWGQMTNIDGSGSVGPFELLGGLFGGGAGYKGTNSAVNAAGRYMVRNNINIPWMSNAEYSTYRGNALSNDFSKRGNRYFGKDVEKNWQQYLGDVYARNRGIEENLIFGDHDGLFFDPKEWDLQELPMSEYEKLYVTRAQQPPMMIHGDPMATGLREAANISGWPTPPNRFPHFKDGKFVAAPTKITSKAGYSTGQLRTHTAENHPIFWSQDKPWYETWGVSDQDYIFAGFTDRKRPKDAILNAREWRKYADDNTLQWKAGAPKEDVKVNKPYRFITTDAKNLTNLKDEGYIGWTSNSALDGGVPMNVLEGFEYNPLTKTWGKVKYTDSTPQFRLGTLDVTTVPRPTKPISSAEMAGVPKGERTPQRPNAGEIPITLVNRGDNYIPVKDGQFIFESPEKAKKLATIHFTQTEPVTGNSGGSWDEMSTTLLLPYNNMRKAELPINIEPGDTFFPNYKGLKVNTKGAKVITGDKKIYDYYKSQGVDVEYSQELADLRQQYDRLYKEATDYAKKTNYNTDDPVYHEKYRKASEVAEKIQKIHSDFVAKHRKMPTFKDMKKLEKIEGLSSHVSEYKGQVATELQRRLGFTYTGAPPTHASLEYVTPGDEYYNNFPARLKKYIDWITKHKRDYRTDK